MYTDNNSYNYLYLEPGYYARFSKDIQKSELEVYDKETGKWKVETNHKLIKRLNQDSSIISYHEFLKYSEAK